MIEIPSTAEVIEIIRYLVIGCALYGALLLVFEVICGVIERLPESVLDYLLSFLDRYFGFPGGEQEVAKKESENTP